MLNLRNDFQLVEQVARVLRLQCHHALRPPVDRGTARGSEQRIGQDRGSGVAKGGVGELPAARGHAGAGRPGPPPSEFRGSGAQTGSSGAHSRPLRDEHDCSIRRAPGEPKESIR